MFLLCCGAIALALVPRVTSLSPIGMSSPYLDEDDFIPAGTTPDPDEFSPPYVLRRPPGSPSDDIEDAEDSESEDSYTPVGLRGRVLWPSNFGPLILSRNGAAYKSIRAVRGFTRHLCDSVKGIFCSRHRLRTPSLSEMIDWLVADEVDIRSGYLHQTALLALATFERGESEGKWMALNGPKLLAFAMSEGFADRPDVDEILQTLLLLMSDLTDIWEIGDAPVGIDEAMLGRFCVVHGDRLKTVLRRDYDWAWNRRFEPIGSRRVRLFILAHTPITAGHLVCPALFESPEMRQIVLSYRTMRERWDTNASPPRVDLTVARLSLLNDTIEEIDRIFPDEFRGDLRVEFEGEEGTDLGGLSREWFTEVGKEMTKIDYGFFEPIDGDRAAFRIRSSSAISEDHCEKVFGVFGKLAALSVVNRVPLGVSLSHGLWRQVLGERPSLGDMEHDEPAIYRSLQLIATTNLSDPANEILADTLTMSFDDDQLGLVVHVPLVAGGEAVSVTQDNKAEYIERYVAHRYFESVTTQVTAFVDGFHSIIPLYLMEDLVTVADLDSFLHGESVIDVEDLRAHSEIGSGYNAESPQVVWFWELVRDDTLFSQERLRLLLQFVTGDASVPVGGFRNMGQRFKVSRDTGSEPDERLPTAATCFYRINIPLYSSKEILSAKLITAIESKSGFELTL